MTKAVINIGTTANDGTGDTLRAAGQKMNDNFTELYDRAQVPSGGAAGQILKKNSATEGDVGWRAAPVEVPIGGTTGQVLSKTSNSDGDVGWTTPSSGGGGASNLAGLGDVVLTSPANNHVLTYDAAASKWVNSPAQGATPTSYTYFKFLMTTNAGLFGAPGAKNAFAAAEMWCYDASGAAHTPSASSASQTYSATSTANLYDGSVETVWSSNDTGSTTLTFQYAAAFVLDHISITCNTSAYLGDTPAYFDVFGSNDGVDYRHIGKVIFPTPSTSNQVITGYL